MSYDLEALHPAIRRQVKAANIKSSAIGTLLDDLEPFSDSTMKYVRKWLEFVQDGKVIFAHGQKTSGKGLLLVGKPGHGKTTLATAALQELIVHGSNEMWKSQEILPRPAYFTDYPTLLRTKQRAFSGDENSQNLVDAVFGETKAENQVRVLVLDDLGKEHRTASGWAEHEFDAVLRRRHSLGLPTIVTTNVPLSQWAEVYGESMASFAHEAFVTLDVVSPEGDRRV